MSKYTLDIKLQVVADYEAGVGGYKTLSKKYAIGSSIIKRWIHNYQDFGPEGLYLKSTKTYYPVETKLNAIELYLTTELSYREVGVKFGINNPSLIANWLRTFKKKGIDGLSKSIGRPPTVSKQEKNTPKAQNTKTETDINALQERIKTLEATVEQLDIENKFLKELRRLREAKKRRHKKT